MAIKQALREFQSRLAQRMQEAMSQAQAGSMWLAVEAAGHGFLLPLSEAGEIFMSSSTLVPVPHTHPWFLGVANLRGQLHGVVDLAAFLGLPARTARLAGDAGGRDAGQLVAFNTALQLNVALLIDRLMGLRHAGSLTPAAEPAMGGRPHFVGDRLTDDQGRSWYELDLAALAADEAFLKIDV
jgi:twitching motility protein PilI